jgi:hypothetical protein
MTEQQAGQAKVRPDLFLPRHPGDVVRLITALAVLLVSIRLVNRNHIDELEIDASGWSTISPARCIGRCGWSCSSATCW